MEMPCPGLALGQHHDLVHYVINFYPLPGIVCPTVSLLSPQTISHDSTLEVFTALPYLPHFLSLTQPMCSYNHLLVLGSCH